jgi:hypothetical protein
VDVVGNEWHGLLLSWSVRAYNGLRGGGRVRRGYWAPDTVLGLPGGPYEVHPQEDPHRQEEDQGPGEADVFAPPGGVQDQEGQEGEEAPRHQGPGIHR